MPEMVIESGTITFSFKMKEPTAVSEVIRMVKNLDTDNIETVDTTAIPTTSYAQITNTKPPRKKPHRRRWDIDPIGTVDCYGLGAFLHPELEDRNRQYRAVGADYEKNYRKPNGDFDDERFIRDKSIEVKRVLKQREIGANQLKRNF